MDRHRGPQRDVEDSKAGAHVEEEGSAGGHQPRHQAWQGARWLRSSSTSPSSSLAWSSPSSPSSSSLSLLPLKYSKELSPHSAHSGHSLIIYLITDTGLRNPHDDKDGDVDDSLVTLQDQHRIPFNYFWTLSITFTLIVNWPFRTIPSTLSRLYRFWNEWVSNVKCKGTQISLKNGL